MDLLDEVTRDENFERNIRFFKRFLYIAACVLVVGLFFIWWYTSYINRSNQDKIELSDQLFKAVMSSGDDKVAMLNKIADYHAKLPSKELAKLYLSILEIKSGDIDKAKTSLQKVVENNSYNPLTTHYAAYLLLSLAVDRVGLFTEQEMIKYFDMFNDKKAPLRFSATILKGLWLYNNDKLSEAKVVLKSVLDENKSKNNLWVTQAKALLSNINVKKQDIKLNRPTYE